MHFHIVSFSYKNSSVEVREKLDLSSEDKYLALTHELFKEECFSEVLIQSTCNRIEIVSWVLNTHDATKIIIQKLVKKSTLTKETLLDHADIFTNDGAIHHLFSVASSLDSLVVGETQIVGQMRDAYRNSFDHKYCAKELSTAMRSAFKCAAIVRESTNISSKPVSIASIAVLKAKEVMGTFTNTCALVIGAGDMSRIATQYLVSHGCKVTIINRSRHKAQAIADEVGEDVVVEAFDTLADLINTHDLLVTATGASEPIITQTMIKYRDSKRFWFDLAIPRDIEITSTPSIVQFIVDDLEEIAQENRDFRQEEAKESFSIIREHTTQFFEKRKKQGIEPIIKAMYLKAEEASLDETKRVLEKGFIPKEYENALQKATLQANKRFLHSVTAKIRELSNDKEGNKLLENLHYMLEIHQDETLKD